MRICRLLFGLCVLLCPLASRTLGQTIRCNSDDGGRNFCQADTRNGVTMVKQISGSACQQGYSWDYDERGIWVDHGCRADFALQGASYPNGGETIYCASDDGGKHYCQAETRAGVALVKQKSGSACEQGYSWGFDDRGIWVDHGCRADFALVTGPQHPQGGGGVGGTQTITCSSDDGNTRYCPADTRGDVELVRQRSKSECREGETWGFDQNGIWVDRGCRADFLVQPNERPEYSDQPVAEGRTISCSSDDGGKNYCETNTRGGVQVVKQRSGAACSQGYSWDFDDRGIWVDHGCRADFLVGGGGRYAEHEHRHGRSCNRAVGEQRASELVEQCLQVSPATHPPCNAQNSCRLITDEIRRSCQLIGNGAPGFCDEYR